MHQEKSFISCSIYVTKCFRFILCIVKGGLLGFCSQKLEVLKQESALFHARYVTKCFRLILKNNPIRVSKVVADHNDLLKHWCPVHLISNLVIDYIQKRREGPGLFSFEYNLLPKLITIFYHYMAEPGMKVILNE